MSVLKHCKITVDMYHYHLLSLYPTILYPICFIPTFCGLKKKGVSQLNSAEMDDTPNIHHYILVSGLKHVDFP